MVRDIVWDLRQRGLVAFMSSQVSERTGVQSSQERTGGVRLSLSTGLVTSTGLITCLAELRACELRKLLRCIGTT